MDLIFKNPKSKLPDKVVTVINDVEKLELYEFMVIIKNHAENGDTMELKKE